MELIGVLNINSQLDTNVRELANVNQNLQKQMRENYFPLSV